MMTTGLPPGFFGKVTSHGDFVSRRLPPSFIEKWDAWLQASLLASREKLGQSWLETYLTSPIWRFALSADVVDSNAWAGILMPSVDRVGRHFPLTITASVEGGAATLNWLVTEKKWFDELEDLALSSLEIKFQLEPFDLALQGRPGLTNTLGQLSGKRLNASAWCYVLDDLEKVEAAAGTITQAIANTLLSGHSLWWTQGSQKVPPCLIVCQGLPGPAQFSAMLDGSGDG
jgi:type VI secretion system protein ImpM